MWKFELLVLGLITSASLVSGSLVKGSTFDRFVIVWMENTDYSKAIGDPSLAALAKKGLTLTNYFAITHPSQPNYIASVGGDTFGVSDDSEASIPADTKTIVDLLESKGVSWGEYQEDMPEIGYTGLQSGEYVRRHNPLIIFDSVATSPTRAAQIKPLTSFSKDLEAEVLPQWMFITPNLNNDGHDTSVTTAGAWVSNFITPLLDNPYFNNNTLIILTFDESHNYFAENRVLAIQLGDIIPKNLTGKTDATSYNHYSLISTISKNWGLGNLGQNDVGAQPFTIVH